jgi:hypothetical protein
MSRRAQHAKTHTHSSIIIDFTKTRPKEIRMHTRRPGMEDEQTREAKQEKRTQLHFVFKKPRGHRESLPEQSGETPGPKEFWRRILACSCMRSHAIWFKLHFVRM